MFLTFRHAKRNVPKHLCSSQREYVLESGDLAFARMSVSLPWDIGQLSLLLWVFICFCILNWQSAMGFCKLWAPAQHIGVQCNLWPALEPGSVMAYGRANTWETFDSIKITHLICISILEAKEFGHAYKMFHLCEHEHLLQAYINL